MRTFVGVMGFSTPPRMLYSADSLKMPSSWPAVMYRIAVDSSESMVNAKASSSSVQRSKSSVSPERLPQIVRGFLVVPAASRRC